MRTYLQLGHGMLSLTLSLLERWPESGAILSPRDLTAQQMRRIGRMVAEGHQGHEVMVDPQCYLHDANHHLLIDKEHEYFVRFTRNTTAQLCTPAGAVSVLQPLGELNEMVGSTAFVAPGLLATVTDEWNQLHRVMLEASRQVSNGRPLFATIAVRPEGLQTEDQVETIAAYASSWDVDGYYLICEPPNEAYLVTNPIWTANVLTLAALLKLTGRRLVCGYSSHQFLSLASVNPEAIALGTFLNVRSFGSGKFYEPESGMKQKSVWYYCPQALSEYQIFYLDIAKRNGVLSAMRPQPPLSADECALLFGQADPSAVDWGERQSFRHYLSSLYWQAYNMDVSSYAAAIAACHRLLDEADDIAETLRRHGVISRPRGIYGGALDATRAALITLDNALGYRLANHWN